MGDRKDGDARLSRRRIEKALRIERLAFEPCLEPGRGENAIQVHGELEPVLRWKEGFEIDDSDLVEWRRLDLPDQGRQVEVDAVPPGVTQEGRHEAVLTAAGRRVNAGEYQRARRRAAGPLRQQLRVVAFGRRGSRE
jgi:hypothetical protein